MRIGIFTDTYYPEINGVATSIQQLKRGLEFLGQEVYVFAPNNNVEYEDEKNVIRERSIPFLLLKDRRMCCFRVSKAMKKVKELNLDIIHSQTEFEMGHLAKRSAYKYNLPFIHTYHTVYEDYTHYLRIPGCNSAIMKSLARKFSKATCNHARAVVVPTDKVNELLRKYGVKREIFVQATGVNYEKFKFPDMEKVGELKKKYGIPQNCRNIIYVGRLAKEKNIGELVNFIPEIKEKVPDLKFIIVGDGPERASIINRAEKLNVSDDIIFTGAVPWSEIENYYALGDIFVSGSTSETQGLTYIEALAAGKPLLVRYDDCLKNVLVEGKNGVSYKTEEDFVKGYFDISENYENMAYESAEKGKEFSNLIFAQNMLNIYRKMIVRE